MAKILIVDDEQNMRYVLTMMLEGMGHKADQAENGSRAWKKIQANGYDVIITDIKMDQMDGRELLQHIKSSGKALPVIFITAFATVESAVEIMKMGAVDYITKPFEEERIRIALERALSFQKVLTEKVEVEDELKRRDAGSELIYNSAEMEEVVSLARKVADTETAVMITGESGTGKEVLARFIHKNSNRSGGRFVPVNCAAISENLVESELFGYERGAFTGANKTTRGKFEFASGGTIFLDEIGDMPLEAQSKLLRTLQGKTVQRVGGHEDIPVDVRVICATNKDLGAMVKENRFRQDLFYRINVFPIDSPPLRNRKDDIKPLAEFFLKQCTGGKGFTLSRGAINRLRGYTWPGNVRELANVMERAVILEKDSGEITEDTLSFLRPQSRETGGEVSDLDLQIPEGGISLDELEKKLVKKALEKTGKNQTASARLLGLSRAKFRVLLKKLEE